MSDNNANTQQLNTHTYTLTMYAHSHTHVQQQRHQNKPSPPSHAITRSTGWEKNCKRMRLKWLPLPLSVALPLFLSQGSHWVAAAALSLPQLLLLLLTSPVSRSCKESDELALMHTPTHAHMQTFTYSHMQTCLCALWSNRLPKPIYQMPISLNFE